MPASTCPMSPHDAFVTGIGIVSPAGCGREATWASLLAGQTCVRRIERGNLTGCTTNLAGVVRDFLPPEGTESTDRVCQFAVAAAEEAVVSAGLGADKFQALGPRRSRVSIGTSKGGMLTFASVVGVFSGKSHMPGDTVHRLGDIPPDAPARHVAARFGIRGGMHTSVAACTTGTLAVIRAAQWIHDGEADVVLCGSSDASLHPLWFGAFQRMNVLALEHPSLGPAWACRPFDQSRKGFAMGEGAAILVLESARSIRCRSGSPIARITGYATGTDPVGLTQLTADGSPLRRVIQLACDRAGCQPESISCIHAHGTGTLGNDLIETRAIRRCLGARAAEVPIVSLKGAIGHLLGAAGAVELAVAALTCRDHKCPGTSTLLEPDPHLGQLTLPTKAFEIPKPECLLKTSLGFGGQLAAVIIEPT